MKYRVLGKTGVKVSALGFGMMRLPVDKSGVINEPTTIDMVRYAMNPIWKRRGQ
jgi:predicted aldo/keto reductase-like oxidoreductase